MNAVTEQMPEPLVFTDSAAGKVKQLIEEEGHPDLKLRVFVLGSVFAGIAGDAEAAQDFRDSFSRLVRPRSGVLTPERPRRWLAAPRATPGGGRGAGAPGRRRPRARSLSSAWSCCRWRRSGS